jgi:hypothetical protein
LAVGNTVDLSFAGFATTDEFASAHTVPMAARKQSAMDECCGMCVERLR